MGTDDAGGEALHGGSWEFKDPDELQGLLVAKRGYSRQAAAAKMRRVAIDGGVPMTRARISASYTAQYRRQQGLPFSIHHELGYANASLEATLRRLGVGNGLGEERTRVLIDNRKGESFGKDANRPGWEMMMPALHSMYIAGGLLNSDAGVTAARTTLERYAANHPGVNVAVEELSRDGEASHQFFQAAAIAFNRKQPLGPNTVVTFTCGNTADVRGAETDVCVAEMGASDGDLVVSWDGEVGTDAANYGIEEFVWVDGAGRMLLVYTKRYAAGYLHLNLTINKYLFAAALRAYDQTRAAHRNGGTLSGIGKAALIKAVMRLRKARTPLTFDSLAGQLKADDASNVAECLEKNYLSRYAFSYASLSLEQAHYASALADNGAGGIEAPPVPALRHGDGTPCAKPPDWDNDWPRSATGHVQHVGGQLLQRGDRDLHRPSRWSVQQTADYEEGRLLRPTFQKTIEVILAHATRDYAQELAGDSASSSDDDDEYASPSGGSAVMHRAGRFYFNKGSRVHDLAASAGPDGLRYSKIVLLPVDGAGTVGKALHLLRSEQAVVVKTSDAGKTNSTCGGTVLGRMAGAGLAGSPLWVMPVDKTLLVGAQAWVVEAVEAVLEEEEEQLQEEWAELAPLQAAVLQFVPELGLEGGSASSSGDDDEYASPSGGSAVMSKKGLFYFNKGSRVHDLAASAGPDGLRYSKIVLLPVDGAGTVGKALHLLRSEQAVVVKTSDAGRTNSTCGGTVLGRMAGAGLAGSPLWVMPVDKTLLVGAQARVVEAVEAALEEEEEQLQEEWAELAPLQAAVLQFVPELGLEGGSASSSGDDDEYASPSGGSAVMSKNGWIYFNKGSRVHDLAASAGPGGLRYSKIVLLPVDGAGTVGKALHLLRSEQAVVVKTSDAGKTNSTCGGTVLGRMAGAGLAGSPLWVMPVDKTLLVGAQARVVEAVEAALEEEEQLQKEWAELAPLQAAVLQFVPELGLEGDSASSSDDDDEYASPSGGSAVMHREGRFYFNKGSRVHDLAASAGPGGLRYSKIVLLPVDGAGTVGKALHLLRSEQAVVVKTSDAGRTYSTRGGTVLGRMAGAGLAGSPLWVMPVDKTLLVGAQAWVVEAVEAALEEEEQLQKEWAELAPLQAAVLQFVPELGLEGDSASSSGDDDKYASPSGGSAVMRKNGWIYFNKGSRVHDLAASAGPDGLRYSKIVLLPVDGAGTVGKALHLLRSEQAVVVKTSDAGKTNSTCGGTVLGRMAGAGLAGSPLWVMPVDKTLLVGAQARVVEAVEEEEEQLPEGWAELAPLQAAVLQFVPELGLEGGSASSSGDDDEYASPSGGSAVMSKKGSIDFNKGSRVHDLAASAGPGGLRYSKIVLLPVDGAGTVGKALHLLRSEQAVVVKTSDAGRTYSTCGGTVLGRMAGAGLAGSPLWVMPVDKTLLVGAQARVVEAVQEVVDGRKRSPVVTTAEPRPKRQRRLSAKAQAA